MNHEDFIAEVAKRLDWPEEKISGIIGIILEVVSAELKMNNPVVIDDFGTLKTDIQPEYILVNPENKERHLMPPAVEVVFESLYQEDSENLSRRAVFTPDETLYNDLNSSFSQFEPTPLNEGVQFPGIPERVAGEPEEQEPLEFAHSQEEESILPEEISYPEKESMVSPEIVEPTEFIQRKQSADVEQSPPRYRSRRGLRINKKTSSVWIPIAGGIAIVVASLFFFKGDGNR